MADERALAAASPRVDPLPVQALDWRSRVVVSLIARATGGEAPRVFTTLARHPRLFRRWLPFGGTLLLRTDLPRRDVELVVLRTAHNASCPYIWTQHVPRAVAAGVGGAAIGAVPQWRESAQWSPRQQALLEAADQLHATRVIVDDTWSRLERLLTERERIEVCFLVGHYEMLAMALNSLGVESEPEASAGLDDRSARVAAGLHRRLAGRRAAIGDPAAPGRAVR